MTDTAVIERKVMDQDGMVLFMYLNDEGRTRWGYRIFEDQTKKELLDWSNGHTSKGGAFLAMHKALKKLEVK